MVRIAPKVLLPGRGVKERPRHTLRQKSGYRGRMDKTMSKLTREEILMKLRRRYATAGPEHKRKLLDQAQELLGYHRKAAIRAWGQPAVVRGPLIITGRPVKYEPSLLVPWLKPIWRATDYACGRRLVAMLPEWIPAYEQHERRMPGEVREKLLLASGRTLDRLLEPLRGQGMGRIPVNCRGFFSRVFCRQNMQKLPRL